MIHFLGIGAQKAGTTWIYQHLSRHPQIRFPAGKEIHFWDSCRSNGVEWWTGLFADDHQRRKQGEITPAYAMLDEATIREIATLLPNLRVFYSLRNPIARAWSSALMALERAEMTIDEASHSWFLDHFKSAGSRRRGDYLSCIKRWQSIFPGEQFLTIVFDDIIKDPEGILSMLCRHLGIDPNWVDEVPTKELRKPVFAGPGHDLPEPLLGFLRILYKPMIDPLSELISRDLSSWLDWDGKRGGG
jgi:Sulfotransferase domain